MPWTHCTAVLALVTAGLLGSTAACEEIVVERDITYGTGGETALKLDLARPAGEGPFPAIVFIHGGGWHAGDRHAYDGQIKQAAERGYVAATISYRLVKFDEETKATTTAKQNFPAQIHDAKAAIRWLRANAAKYRVAPEKIGVAGASAGGHLALLVGLIDPKAQLEGEGGHPEQGSRVQAVVNFFGPTEMESCYKESSVAWMLRLFLGGKPSETPAAYRKASPLTYVSSDDPPVLTFHGDQDQLVPVAQAKTLDEKMQSAGAPHELVIFEGHGHGFGGETQQKALKAMWNFFDEHLKR